MNTVAQSANGMKSPVVRKGVAPKSIRAGLSLLCLFDCFFVQDVDIHLDLHNVLDRIHLRVEVNAEILPIDLKVGAKTAAVVLVEDLSDLDLNLFGHAAHIQIALYLVDLVANFSDFF